MNETILAKASIKENWQTFLQYKLEKQHLSKKEAEDIQDFIDHEVYLELCQLWRENIFPSDYAHKKIINKEGSKKKRVVYSYDNDEGIFLKFIAFQLSQYDHIFCDNCYAFRQNYGVSDALQRIKRTPALQKMYCLKADISNYFNSIDVNLLSTKLSFIKESDDNLYQLFERILLEDKVYENGKIIHDQHGAMAGTPVSAFFANVYLSDIDYYFQKEQILYFRYSDDILIFTNTMEELIAAQNMLYQKIIEHGLSINPEKVTISEPGEEWDFLGFCYRNGEIDLSRNTIRKAKGKIRRKAESLRRWQRKKGLSSDKAAIGFIRAMNHKFYGGQDEADFTWSRWFFPNLTVDTGLKEIDAYMQQYIRYTVTGRHYKGNYRISYEDLKKWGYRSLVHEFWK